MAVGITGSNFASLEAAINKVKNRANAAFKSISKIFNTDFSGSPIFGSIDKLNTKLALANARTSNLASTLKMVSKLNVNVKTPRQGGSSASSSQSGVTNLLDPLVAQRRRMFFQRKTLEDIFNFKTGMKSGGAGSSWIGKFGNPGDMPLYTRFRVFQRPFPGSERNPFALGDTGNLLNNAIYGTFAGAKAAFTGITNLGSDVIRAFSGIAQVSLSVVSSIAKLGGTAGKVVAALTEVIGLVTEAGLKIFDSLSVAVGHTITAMGTLALGLSGFAYRAVQAASNLTELKNAASIYVGQVGGRSLLNTSMQYQEQFGLSASDSLRLMTRIAGQYRQTTGAGSDDAAKQAETIFKAVADAGSVLNMNLDDMGKTVQSALAGRYTPLRRIGVAVSAPYLDAVAAQMGFAKDAKTPFEARTKALIFEIGRQTKPFIGDLQATQYEFANQQRKLMGQLEAIFTHVGRALEPFAKLLVIATNNLLKLFVDKIKLFADEVETAVENLRRGIRGGWIEESIMKFAQSVAAGADFLLQFAKTVYDARWQILDGAKEFVNTIASLAKSLLNISVSMISVAMTMSKIAARMAKTIDWIPQSEATPELQGAADSGMIVPPMNFGPWLERRLGIGVDPKNRKKTVAENIEDGVNNMGVAVGQINDLIKNIDNIAQKAKDKVNNQPNAPFFQELVKNFMARRIGAPPDFAEPVEIGQKAGALSQFFKPEAYRDEVQTRQVNAAEETAQNTRATVEVLNAIAGNIALAGMKNPVNPGLAIAGGIAAP
jgi:hypothetical protein